MHSIKLTILLVFFSIIHFFAQVPIPSNGAEPSFPRLVALKNAKIIVSPEKIIEKGILLIENGKVKSVGALVNIPKGAVVHDLDGKTIVPAFIESYSSIGLPETVKKPWTPVPQLESSKEGPFHWNEAIKPEVSAAELYKTDEKEAKKLREMGFGFAITHPQDGIIRGSGATIVLGEKDPRKAVIADESGLFFSFKKGSSKQTYPSSQMGAIALIRQTLYDADYYSKYESQLPTNISLKALNNKQSYPILFDVDHHLEILRANEISKEFNFPLIAIGAGNEYLSIKQLSEYKFPLVVPITFPEAYDVKDPFVARQIPLRDLKHWEQAPSNLYYLNKKGIPVAITSKGIKKAEEFWKNLHAAMERGLSPKDAIAALTTTPAKLFNLSHQLGTLEEGMIASFSVFDLDPFVFTDATLEEAWTKGKQEVFVPTPDADFRGTFNLTINGVHTYPIVIEGKRNKPSGKLYYKEITKADSTNTKDSSFVKLAVSLEGNSIQLFALLTKGENKGPLTLQGKYNEKLGIMEGQGFVSDGSWVKWAAIKNKKHTDKTIGKRLEIDSIEAVKTWFPNMAYGFERLPEKKMYVLRNATVWTNEEQGIIKEGTVILQNGKIQFVGTGNYLIPGDAIEIDAKGLHITSGIIDEHSHIAISKGVNEAGQSNSAEVRIGDVVRNDDINIYRQLSGGVTVAQLLHGSANAIGGQSALVKLKWGYSPQEMLIPNAPKFIKFALGENVKQANWGDFQKVRFPQTRMGVEQLFYNDFRRAKEYKSAWEKYNLAQDSSRKNKPSTLPPARNLELEALVEILDKERFITCHSYVQSEINMLMHVADSLGFVVNTFTHILEGYKLADQMREHGAGASTFADWWGYKFEVNDAIPFNASLLNERGVLVAINSDDAEMGRRLNQEAAKSVKYGGMSQEDAWKMVTLNPAKLLHLDDRMGSLKVGKDADVVIWTDNPLSIHAKVVSVFIDGELVYNYKEDQRAQSRNQSERARIIAKMLEDNKKGNPSKPFIKKEEKHWHCDTIGEHGEE